MSIYIYLYPHIDIKKKIKQNITAFRMPNSKSDFESKRLSGAMNGEGRN